MHNLLRGINVLSYLQLETLMGLFFSFLLPLLWAVLLLLGIFPSPSLSLRQQELHSTMSPPLRRRHQPRRNPQRLHMIVRTRPYHAAADQVVGRHQAEEEKTRERGRNFGARQVSAMLPRGVVPPSGSSACHNSVPGSLDYYCRGIASAFHP